jgi:predicted transcriptional regulator
MNVSELAIKLGAKILTGENECGTQINGVYCGDLLSWVMSHAGKGFAWITVHTNLNIVAVAALCDLACIIIPENIDVEEATIKRAAGEGIPILSTQLSTYEVCCAAYECGIRQKKS